MKAATFSKFILSVFAVAVMASGAAQAASKEKIDRRTDEALTEFRSEISGADEVLAKAAGVLVFPSVKKAGIGIGGEYGEGALRVGNQSAAYYSTASASIGFQLGAQARRQIIVFSTRTCWKNFASAMAGKSALTRLSQSSRWMWAALLT